MDTSTLTSNTLSKPTSYFTGLTITIAIAYLIGGYNTYILRDLISQNSDLYHLMGPTETIGPAFSIIGGMLGVTLAEKFGRRVCLVLSTTSQLVAIPFTTSGYYLLNIPLLAIGNAILGLGFGVITFCVPIFSKL